MVCTVENLGLASIGRAMMVSMMERNESEGRQSMHPATITEEPTPLGLMYKN